MAEDKNLEEPVVEPTAESAAEPATYTAEEFEAVKAQVADLENKLGAVSNALGESQIKMNAAITLLNKRSQELFDAEVQLGTYKNMLGVQ